MYSEGFSAEVWFRARMVSLKMLDPQPPSLQTVKNVLNQYFKGRVERALLHIIDDLDAEEWLDLVLKVDVLLSLQNIEGRALRIAVDITTSPLEVANKIEIISSRLFQIARRKLEIDCHWVVLVNPLSLPSRDRLLDVFYEVADQNKECVVIEF